MQKGYLVVRCWEDPSELASREEMQSKESTTPPNSGSVGAALRGEAMGDSSRIRLFFEVEDTGTGEALSSMLGRLNLCWELETSNERAVSSSKSSSEELHIHRSLALDQYPSGQYLSKQSHFNLSHVKGRSSYFDYALLVSPLKNGNSLPEWIRECLKAGPLPFTNP